MSISHSVTSTGATEGQYLHASEIFESFKDIDLSDLELIRMDSYSDTAILQKIKSTKKEKELLCSAIQTSIIGMGNKLYGSMMLQGNVINIEELYKQCGVKTKLNLGAVLLPEDLTGRRLQRFFRKQISEYIKANNTPSYLWRKYSDHNEAFKHLVFPGAEHLVESEEELVYLYSVYKALDQRINSKISERIHRVFNARGFYVPIIEKDFLSSPSLVGKVALS
jgi:hypothetical protein